MIKTTKRSFGVRAKPKKTQTRPSIPYQSSQICRRTMKLVKERSKKEKKKYFLFFIEEKKSRVRIQPYVQNYQLSRAGQEPHQQTRRNPSNPLLKQATNEKFKKCNLQQRKINFRG